jgi:hypothetical protein
MLCNACDVALPGSVVAALYISRILAEKGVEFRN